VNEHAIKPFICTIGTWLKFLTSIINYLHNLCTINVHPLYVEWIFEVKTYGLSQPSTLPIYMKFSISFFEKIYYRDLIFDK
jgi:hypothetical protein